MPYTHDCCSTKITEYFWKVKIFVKIKPQKYEQVDIITGLLFYYLYF